MTGPESHDLMIRCPGDGVNQRRGQSTPQRRSLRYLPWTARPDPPSASPAGGDPRPACDRASLADVGARRHHSSVVEQRFCKPQVVGSNPTGGFGVGQSADSDATPGSAGRGESGGSALPLGRILRPGQRLGAVAGAASISSSACAARRRGWRPAELPGLNGGLYMTCSRSLGRCGAVVGVNNRPVLVVGLGTGGAGVWPGGGRGLERCSSG